MATIKKAAAVGATITPQQAFINTYWPLAVAATKNTPIFPETTITQMIAESGWKVSDLGRLHNNYHGIKAYASWKGPVVSMTTQEEANGKRYTVKGTGKAYNNRAEALKDGAAVESIFRKYATPLDGFKGHVAILLGNTTYAKNGALKATTADAQLKAIAQTGYATASNYLTLLNNILSSIRSRIKNVPTAAVAAGGGLAAVLFFFSFINW